MCAPPLTTVSMPMESAGRTAVDILLRRQNADLSTPDRQYNTQLATELIVRSTTAPPKDAA
jgi:DNA-binding LacI/PurR family transcriptional regulator